jgi:hypothetical protein
MNNATLRAIQQHPVSFNQRRLKEKIPWRSYKKKKKKKRGEFFHMCPKFKHMKKFKLAKLFNIFSDFSNLSKQSVQFLVSSKGFILLIQNNFFSWDFQT